MAVLDNDLIIEESSLTGSFKKVYVDSGTGSRTAIENVSIGHGSQTEGEEKQGDVVVTYPQTIHKEEVI